MKFVFENNLIHQSRALNSIVNIFENVQLVYDNSNTTSSVNLYNIDNNLTSNPIIPADSWNSQCLQNIKNIQLNNALPQTQFIDSQYPTFDIEMETGTGKTYVYLKTIFELNKKYKFNKFIILVPSKAIKEGVKKTFQITKEHFKSLYDTPLYNYSDYDSNNLNILNDFVDNPNLEIMIMNIQQINKDIGDENINSNNVYKYQDILNGQRPIDMIQRVRPVVIIDEPQSVASGEKSINAIKQLTPSFILRYSATFRKRKDEMLMYKLDTIDAYNQNLVKSIWVNSKQNDDINEDKLLNLFSLDPIDNSAKLEINVIQRNKETKTKKIKIKVNDNLYLLSGQNKDYEGYIVSELNFEENYILFSNNEPIYKGQHNSNLSYQIKHWQIKETIETHLNKQIKYKKDNIKVLSLFFIDRVDKYRIYNLDKTYSLGEYGKIFEEELTKILTNNPIYKDILGKYSVEEYVSKCHNGYFSMDKKGQYIDSSKNGDSLEDQNTYNKIMKDKERLLSFDEPLSFIFSHTALKEGWDNPNVFQICTLNETTSEMKKRQEIGRGFRLCVNQNGERIHDKKINKLDIIANESYKSFVSKLEKEMRDDGITFGDLKIEDLVKDKLVTNEEAQKVITLLKKENYIDFKTNEIINKNAKREDIVQLLASNIALQNSKAYDYIAALYLDKWQARKYKVNDANKKYKNHLNKEVLNSEEFTELWNQIKTKTRYKIKFNTEQFINNVKSQINDAIKNNQFHNSNLNFTIIKSNIEIDKDKGVSIGKINKSSKYTIDTSNFPIKDILSDLENRTSIQRKLLVGILCKEEIYNSLKNNYELTLNLLVDIINKQKLKLIINGLEYYKINEEYKLEQFDPSEEICIDDKNLIYEIKNLNKYPYTYVKTDSKIESNFAQESDESDWIMKFIKLPSWFKIKTPVGTYNPDWALYSNNQSLFVAETKGSTNEDNLRKIEEYKIKCAREHFRTISNSKVKYEVAQDLVDLINK